MAPIDLKELRSGYRSELRSRFRIGLGSGDHGWPSPADLRAFFKVMDRWDIEDNQACIVLGGMSRREYFLLRSGNDQILNEDNIRRISGILEISGVLDILYADKSEAADWMKTRKVFLNGERPDKYLLQVGWPAIGKIKQFLDEQLKELRQRVKEEMANRPHLSLKRFRRLTENEPVAFRR